MLTNELASRAAQGGSFRSAFVNFNPPGSTGNTGPDAIKYVASNADLIQAVLAQGIAGDKLQVAIFGREHYNNYGKSEGRSITFDTASYASKNPDLGRARIFDWETAAHYIEFGFTERRQL